MSDITFFPLGGMDENDKPCYVLTVDDNHFLINIGVSLTVFDHLGIKKVLPYLEWVKKNHQNIKGILIGNANYTNIGGILYCYNWIKNIPIYTSKINAEIITSLFTKRVIEQNDMVCEGFNFKLLIPLKTVHINDKIKIIPFRVTTAIPDSLGFVIKVEQENIIYLDDFVVYNDAYGFVNDISKLPFLTFPNTNTLLIVNVGNVTKNKGFSFPHFYRYDFYKNLLLKNSTKRLLVVCNYCDLYSLITLAQLAQQKQLPFVVYNPLFMPVFNLLLNNRNFNLNKLLLLSLNKINEIEKGIVLISTIPERLFAKLLSIGRDEDDILGLKKSDTVVLGFKTDVGFEKNESMILDHFANLELEVYPLPKEIINLEASQEDHRYLVNLLKPKYIIPTMGLYYQMIEYTHCLSKINFNPNRVICMYNGEVAKFHNQQMQAKIKSTDIYPVFVGIHGIMHDDENILREREIMGANGIIFCVFKLNTAQNFFDKRFYEIIPYGVTFENQTSMKVFNDIKQDIFDFVSGLLTTEKSYNLKSIKDMIRKRIAKKIEKTLFKNPLIIVSIYE